MKCFLSFENATVQCILCPHQCVIKDGNSGICKVRVNQNQEIVLLTDRKISARNLDPIEKKPLYHFFPGSKIFSIGSIGCNLQCVFCQNHEISQANNQNLSVLKMLSSEQIVDMALKQPGNIGIAFTFNEPVISFEYNLKTAQLSHESGMKNVYVSNGYINRNPLKELCKYVDAWNVDLKAFNNTFYQQQLGGSLKPVLESLQIIKAEHKHLEITFLLIPGLNDDEGEFVEMLKWIASNLGEHVPLHISRYFPRHKLSVSQTPAELLFRFYELAITYLKFVYLGNIDIPGTSDTYCPQCKNALIFRSGYKVDNKIVNNSYCASCGFQVDIMA